MRVARVPFTSEHARRLQTVTDAGFVGDGQRAFCSISQVTDADHETHSGWLFETDGSSARRVGEELGDLGAIAPAPNGAWLAVIAEVDARRQVFLVPTEGGNARQLTDVSQGVSSPPVWSPDGRLIAFTAGPSVQRDPFRPYWIDRATYRVDGLGYIDDVLQDLYVVNVDTGVVRQLTHDRCMNSEPRWSPDGQRLSYLVSFHPDRVFDFQPELHLIDVQTLESRPIVDTWGAVFSAEWCPDNERLAFIGHPEREQIFAKQRLDLWTIALDGAEPECRTADLRAGVGCFVQTDLPISREIMSQPIRVCGDVAYVRGQIRGDALTYEVALTGPNRVNQSASARGSAYMLDAHPEKGVLYLATSFVEPPELMLGKTRITALNDDLLEELLTPEVRTLNVVAPDGLEIDGWALVPPGKTGPFPTILCVHGGPYFALGSTYNIDFQLLVGAGFAVVFSNFRGSSGYGPEFYDKLVDYWGDSAGDHHATLDAAIDAGIADPDRLGVCGISYGGFASCWLVGTSQRFKAAVVENAFTNWITMYGVADSEWWVTRVLGGTPWEVPDRYHALSPITFAHNCETPVLFVVGEADMRCHPVEAEQYYRVLKARGIPTAMLRLPGSTHLGSWHGPISARTAQNDALVEWFKQYLLAQPTPKPGEHQPASDAASRDGQAMIRLPLRLTPSP